MRFILSAIALTVAAASPVAAVAADSQTVTVRVDTAGIDLTTRAGRADLEARVDAKLRAACTIESNSRYSYGRDVVDQKCIAEARSAVLAQAERIAASGVRGGRTVSAN